MNELTYKKINATDTIIANISKIVEAFVDYYGENEREKITNKFKNMLVIGFSTPNNIKKFLQEDINNKSSELVKYFFEQINVKEEEQKEQYKIYFDDSSLHYELIHPINHYIRFVNGSRDYKSNPYCRKQTINFLKHFYLDVNEDNLDEFIESNKLVEINKAVEVYKEILSKYQEYLNELKPYQDYVDKCQELKCILTRKYLKIFYEEFKYLFTELEQSKINEEINDSGFNNFANSKVPKMKCYFGYNVDSETLIYSFTKENEKILNDDEAFSWIKNSIIADRLKFLKIYGNDLGNDYANYQNNLKIQGMLKKLQDLADKMDIRRKEINTKMVNEYYQSIDEYKKNIQRIEELELLDKEYGYNASTYERNQTCVSTNIKRVGNEYMMYPILCLSMAVPSEYLDHCLFHELNHVYELNLNKVDGNTYYYTCGWEFFNSKINNQVQEVVSLEDNREKRNYELFNEIINELISQEITQIFFSHGQYIFNTKDDAKIFGGTNYEKYKFLVNDFYNLYKKEIIASRQGDMSVLFDRVGKENFEKLNNLFHRFAKEFPGYSVYQTYDDLKNKRETENTKKFMEIFSKKNEILIDMENYLQASKTHGI